GWPAILALFDLTGLRWWSTPLLCTISVLLTYLIGRRGHSPAVGLLAAMVLLLQPWFEGSADGHMAHAAPSALSARAAVLLLAGEGVRAGRRAALWLGAGFLVGAATAVRPLSGVAAGASLAAWSWLRARQRWREVRRLAGALALGALAPVLAVLHYNA